MALLSSLWTGVSGLNANGQWISVIGDNIANVNTNGFKDSRMAFGDILSQTLTGLSGTSQVGRGVAVNGVSSMFTQGSFQNTSSGLDIAIDGDGFFIVKNSGATAYTRAGNFHTDQDGNITTASGAILQGYLADAAGNITGQIGNLQLLGTPIPAFATSTATLGVNLDSTAAVPAAGWATWTAGGTTPPPANVYNSNTSVTAYDSQGNAHQVGVYFVKTGANGWAANYVYQDSAGNYQQAGTQTLAFDTSGALTSSASSGALGFNWGGGVAAGSVTFDLTGTTQLAGSFAVASINQNGYASGTLKNVLIDDKGVVTGVFTNGQTRNLAQLALARFMAPTGLTKLGDNLYAQSNISGQPIVGAPSTSGLGRTLSDTLELSTVDIAGEFTNLIAAQRGFQANTKIITTTDEMISELIAIKQ